MGQYPISMIKIDIIDVHGPQDQYGPLIWKGTPTNVRERWGGRHGEGRVKWSSYQPLVSKQSKAKHKLHNAPPTTTHFLHHAPPLPHQTLFLIVYIYWTDSWNTFFFLHNIRYTLGETYFVIYFNDLNHIFFRYSLKNYIYQKSSKSETVWSLD